MTKFMSQPFDSLKKFISSPLKTDTTFTSESPQNQVYHHRFATEASSFEKQQNLLDNSSNVSFNKPPVSRSEIDEFFQLKKLVHFYSKEVRQKAKVCEECRKKVTNLEQQREDLEERIKAKKNYFSFKKMGLESKKKKIARNRRERGQFFNEQTKQLKNKILKLQFSNYQRLKTTTEKGKYSIPYTDSNPTFSSQAHQRNSALNRESRRTKSTSKTKIVVPIVIPYQPQWHQLSPAHAPYSYSAPHKNVQNSSQNYGYFLESSRQSPLERQETGQFSFADHFGAFKTQLSKTVSKRSEDSHIIPESALSSKRIQSSIRQSRKSSGQSSKIPLSKSKNIHFYEDEVEEQILEKPPSSQMRKTKNSQEDEMLLPPQLIKKKTYQDPKLPLIYEEPNNSTLHVSLMGQTDKQSLEEGKQSPAIPVERKPPSRPRPNRQSREASSKEQSAVVFESKYMAEIKSVSDRSQNEIGSPTHFRVNSNMGNSVEFSPRKEQKIQSQAEKGQLRFNLSAGFKGEPEVSSHYESTYRQNKFSSEEDQDINFQKLSQISRAGRQKLAVKRQEAIEEDDLLSAIHLSTESRISREKHLSKSNRSSARNNSTLLKSDEEGREGDRKARRRTINGKDGQPQQECSEQDLRISTPASAMRDKLGIPQSRLTQSKKTMMNLNASIVEASEGEEEMVSTNRKRRRSREEKPRSQR